MNKILSIVVCYNTAHESKTTLSKFPGDKNYDILVINDGSTDSTSEFIKAYAFKVIEHTKNMGVGAAIKTGIRYALENDYQIVAILAGNNKDNPLELSRLISPIVEEEYDYVQGSRFVAGGNWDNLPPFRFFMVKIHAFIFSLITGRKCTDSLNGFRAYKLTILNDSRINIWQDWLDRYEFETYLHYKVLKYGYKFKEVPVSKIYPKNWRKVKYTHIRPLYDWWIILRPLVYLLLKLRD